MRAPNLSLGSCQKMVCPKKIRRTRFFAYVPCDSKWPPVSLQPSIPILRICASEEINYPSKLRLQEITLTHCDLQSLMRSVFMNDNIINAFIFSLETIPDDMIVYETFYGLPPSFKHIKKQGTAVLVVNNNENHWLTVKMDFNTQEAIIYDSSNKPEPPTIQTYFNSLKWISANVQKQTGPDCGVFALYFLYCAIYGTNMKNINVDEYRATIGIRLFTKAILL